MSEQHEVEKFSSAKILQQQPVQPEANGHEAATEQPKARFAIGIVL